MFPPFGSCSDRKMMMAERTVPASIPPESRKLYFDHHSKFRWRTRYSGWVNVSSRMRRC